MAGKQQEQEMDFLTLQRMLEIADAKRRQTAANAAGGGGVGSIAQDRAVRDVTQPGAGTDMSDMVPEDMLQRIAQIRGLGQAYGSGSGFSPARGPGVKRYADLQAGILEKASGLGLPSLMGQDKSASSAPRPRASRGGGRLSQDSQQPLGASYGQDMVIPPSRQGGNRGKHPLHDAVMRMALQYLNKNNPHRIDSL